MAQLVKDGCDPEAGASKCAACAQQHRADLTKAGCDRETLTAYCEGKAPPPGPPSPPSPPPPAGGCAKELDSLCPVATDPTAQKCAKCAETHVPKLLAAGCDPENIKQMCKARSS